MSNTRIALAAALACGLSFGAQASVLDFEGHPLDGGNPIFDAGFRYDFSASGWGVFSPGDSVCCNNNFNGTTSMFANGDFSGNAKIVMTQVGGGTFDVSQLDLSVYWTGASGSIELIGAIHGGGTVSTILASSSTWTTYSLSGFSNLDSLTFRDTQSGAFLVAPGIGVDNIHVGAVPEPSTYALMALGLAGVGFVARRRRAQV